MKKFTNTLLVFGAVTLMFLLIWGIYIGITFVINQFEIFDARETAIVTVGSLIFLISSLIVATAIRSSIQKGDKKIQPQKAELYSRYSTVYQMLGSDKEDFEKEVRELNRLMILWAADDVLKEYGRLLNMVEKGQKGLESQATNVLMEIRKDLGNRNRGINLELISRRRD